MTQAQRDTSYELWAYDVDVEMNRIFAQRGHRARVTTTDLAHLLTWDGTLDIHGGVADRRICESGAA